MLTLFLGGWGSALAGVLCAGGPGTRMPASHACCRAKKARPSNSSHAASHRDSSQGVLLSSDAGELDTLALARTQRPCSHCFSRPELPATPKGAGQSGQARRGGDAAQTFASERESRRAVLNASSLGASSDLPPVSNTPRHLLISVILV
ncbi:MAG TPA: hypothetical protein VF507_02000 [Pyrinomonadaceae bacterium]